DCDRRIGPSAFTLEFSGTFAGIIIDGPQSGADIQVKLARDGNAVQGSYLRAGLCGTISGDIENGQLKFAWSWGGNSGRGLATQTAETLTGTSGFREQADGGGKFVLFRKQLR